VAGRSLDDPAWDGADPTVADELLVPSVIYSPTIMKLTAAIDVSGIVHITGGGIPGNVPRILHDGVDARIDRSTWEAPRVFAELAEIGDVAQAEMDKTFNMGVGMIVSVPAEQAADALAIAEGDGHQAAIIGDISEGTGSVHLA